MKSGPAEETVFLRSCGALLKFRSFHPGFGPGWDLVLTCSPTPSFQPPGKPRLFLCPRHPRCDPASAAPGCSCASSYGLIAPVAGVHGRSRRCGNGYRDPKHKGKPNFAIARKCLQHRHFLNSAGGRPPRAFTRRSSRYLNCPSKLPVHIRPNKPANGCGE